MAADSDASPKKRARIADDLKPYAAMVDFLGTVFGEDTEVVLDDVRDLNRSIVAIANSHLTGRALGGSATDLILSIFRNPELRARDWVTEYESRSRNGNLFRSHTYFIKGDDGEIIGMLSINTDMRRMLQARDLLTAMTRMAPVDDSGPSGRLDVTPREQTDEAIEREVDAAGIHPSVMTPADKHRVIQRLFESGIFLMRGSVALTAQALLLSEPSIYRYVANARKDQKKRAASTGTGSEE